MSDCNGLTLRRVRYMIRHTVFTERKKNLHLDQNLAIWLIWICINITNGLNSFLSAFFLYERKNLALIFLIKSEIKWLYTFYTIFVFCNTNNYSKRHWKFSSLKSWSIGLSWDVKIMLIILVKFCFFFHAFLRHWWK